MSNLFFDHLILLEEVAGELDAYELDVQEKEELVGLIDQTLHHHTLNVIFNFLPNEKHPEFVEKFRQNPHDQALLEYLKQEIKIDIESEIKKQAQRVKKEILQEISKAKRR